MPDALNLTPTFSDHLSIVRTWFDRVTDPFKPWGAEDLPDSLPEDSMRAVLDHAAMIETPTDIANLRTLRAKANAYDSADRDRNALRETLDKIAVALGFGDLDGYDETITDAMLIEEAQLLSRKEDQFLALQQQAASAVDTIDAYLRAGAGMADLRATRQLLQSALDDSRSTTKPKTTPTQALHVIFNPDRRMQSIGRAYRPKPASPDVGKQLDAEIQSAFRANPDLRAVRLDVEMFDAPDDLPIPEGVPLYRGHRFDPKAWKGDRPQTTTTTNEVDDVCEDLRRVADDIARDTKAILDRSPARRIADAVESVVDALAGPRTAFTFESEGFTVRVTRDA